LSGWDCVGAKGGGLLEMGGEEAGGGEKKSSHRPRWGYALGGSLPFLVKQNKTLLQWRTGGLSHGLDSNIYNVHHVVGTEHVNWPQTIAFPPTR
jgi:hypothetical protein